MSVEPNYRIAHGGKAIYGARLGILMLEARFPRIPGDMGNAETWPFPVLYKVVSGASPQRVVREQAAGLLPDFIAAARELRDRYLEQFNSGLVLPEGKYEVARRLESGSPRVEPRRLPQAA